MEIIDEITQEDFWAVDLHVHTPASSQCYNNGKCNNSDEEYIELLELYRSKNVKVISITDHNTIKGYKKLLSIKCELEKKIKYWCELEDIPGVEEKLEKELSKVKLFQDILILPGVEFEAFPGVHLLLIFDHDTDLTLIEKFLCESGYSEENQGKEKCNISELSVPNVLEKARKLGAITVAAHVDSDKGIFSVLNKGLSRAQVFKTENLMGMQINNLSKISEVNALLNCKEYKREKPLAFVRCSDFHNNKTDIENYVTYMKLETLSFQSVFDAFMNPIERISFTQNPKSIEIINRLIEDSNTIIFKNASDENILPISKATCALLNQGHGTIIIGVNEDKSIIGIRKNKSECDEIVSNILNKFEESKYFLDYKTTTYPYGNGNVLVINLSSQRDSIYNIDNEVYILKDRKVILASPYDLIKIGEERFINKFTEIQTINKKRIQNIYDELEIIKEFEHNLSLYNKINSNSIRLTEVVKINFIRANSNSGDEVLDELIEGTVDGSLFFINHIKKPHEENIYLRCTCPRTNEDLDLEFESNLYEEECIIIVPGGGSHLIKNNQEFKIINRLPVIMLTIKERYKNEYSIESLLAWMKSPILLWYTNFMHDTVDIFKAKALKDMPIIMVESMKPEKEIHNIITGITNKEIDFLSKSQEVYKAFKDAEDNECDNLDNKEAELDALVELHNKAISELAIKIENNIIKDLKITDKELKVVEMFLKQNDIEGIFDYSQDLINMS